VLHALVAAALALVPGKATADPVPILMYHLIAAPPANAAYPELYVRPAEFAGQMRWLRRHGFHAVTLRGVYDHWKLGAPLPRRPIVISFDDGYLSQYTHAFKTLSSYGWPADLDVEVQFLKPRGGLSPWRVRSLIAAGWELDSHTITHPDLTSLDRSRLWQEVDGSRRVLRRLFHVPVAFFCYPAGRFDRRVVRAVRRAGYLGATSEVEGLARPGRLFALDRIRVDGSEGVPGFASELRRLLGT
jgi:peptidoglycan/xylan/chitin deacetylase (PgdA/CDA1 family)